MIVGWMDVGLKANQPFVLYKTVIVVKEGGVNLLRKIGKKKAKRRLTMTTNLTSKY